MLGLLGKGIKKLFGTKSDKDLKLLYPYVDKINSEFNKLSSISDQELRDKTVSFKEKISANTKKVSDQRITSTVYSPTVKVEPVEYYSCKSLGSTKNNPCTRNQRDFMFLRKHRHILIAECMCIT